MAVAGTASAQSLNIDFGQLKGMPSNSYGAASGQIGYWETITSLGMTSGIRGLSGSPTSVDLNLIADRIDDGVGYDSALPNVSETFSDYFYSNANIDWTIQITNLENGNYTVFVYAPKTQYVTTGAFEVAGNLVNDLYGAETDTLVHGIDFNFVNNMVVDNHYIVIDATTLNGFRGISAVQLVHVVPEPTVFTLLPFGLWLLFRRRRRA